MPAPRELPQQIPASPGKSLDAKVPGWGHIFGTHPLGVRGMVMDEIDTCIIAWSSEATLVRTHAWLKETLKLIAISFGSRMLVPSITLLMLCACAINRQSHKSWSLMHQSIPSANTPRASCPPGFCTCFQLGSRDLYHLNSPGVGRGSDLLSVIKVPSCQLMLGEGTFQLQNDLPSACCSLVTRSVSKLGENFKYGT